MKTIYTKNAPEAIGPYSQAIVSGGFIFCSGQLGIDPKTGELKKGIGEQTKQALENLKAVLTQAGSSIEKIVKANCYIINMDDFPEFNRVYGEILGDIKPARACVAVKELPKGALCEVEIIAEI